VTDFKGDGARTGDTRKIGEVYMGSFRTLALISLLAGAAGAASADIYRRTDEQGHVQYSDRWVPGSQLIKVDRNHVSPETAAARTATEQEKLATSSAQISGQLAQEQAARTVKADVAKSKEQACKDATKVYDQAVSSMRFYKEGKDGERALLSDAEADAYRLQAFNNKQTACSK
jgi:hypothetical protein